MRSILAACGLLLLYSCCSGPASSVKTVGNEGKIKFLVEPENAIVYVDGEKKGKADQFDGDPDYLELPGGFHKIEIKKDGYKEYSRKLFTGGSIQEIKVILTENR
jgi:hypothetical protein